LEPIRQLCRPPLRGKWAAELSGGLVRLRLRLRLRVLMPIDCC